MRTLKVIIAAAVVFALLTAATTISYTPPESDIRLLNGLSVPSYFSYCITDTENITGVFRKEMDYFRDEGLIGYQMELMPFSAENTNLVFSEHYKEGGLIDIDAYHLVNTSFEGDMIGLDYLSNNKRERIKIKQFHPSELSVEFFTDGQKNEKKSGIYKYTAQSAAVSAEAAKYLDQYAPKIELDLGLSCYARQYLGLSLTYPLTKKLLSRIKTLSINDYRVKSLTGIEYFTGLTSISIASGDITDISGLSKLTKLELVDISWCYVDKLPDLSQSKGLKELRLPMNNIRNISEMAKLENLEYVDLNSNFVEDISPLKGLKKLKMVSVLNNCILNFSSLKSNETAQKAIEVGCQFSYSECLDNEKLSARAVKRLIKNGMSDIEKELAIYRFVKDTMDYEIVGGGMSPFGYLGLKYHRGVCGNYAETFALLARLAGLNVITASSDTHEWNAILLNNSVYFVDVLWDEGNDNGYYYFNRNGSVVKDIPEHRYDEKRLVFPLDD